MKRKNGSGTTYKLSGNRRRPWIARRTVGRTQEGKPIYETIGYYSSFEEGLKALDEEYGSTVYFISDGEFVKIGKSDNVQNRLKILQTGNPKPLQIIRTIPCKTPKDAYDLESFFHKLLKSVNTSGEWYQLKVGN